MDYEKKYNEAMLRADEAVQKGCLDKDMFDIIFPPEESEDERIRKEIIEFVDTTTLSTDERHHRWIAYLEKQKEQKPVECIEDSVKFEEGFKTGRESGLRDGQKYVLDNAESYGLCKPAEWSEEDEKMIANLRSTLANIAVRGLIKKETEQKYSAWLKSLRPQPKQEWSEEDEDKVAQYLHDRDGGMLWSKATEITRDILDILRPGWKPTEEQMEALQRAIDACESEWAYQDDELRSLLNDLKKL